MKRFEGKTSMVAIGLATALAFANEVARLVYGARSIHSGSGEGSTQ